MEKMTNEDGRIDEVVGRIAEELRLARRAISDAQLHQIKAECILADYLDGRREAEGRAIRDRLDGGC